jgi:hypothetical protein
MKASGRPDAPSFVFGEQLVSLLATLMRKKEEKLMVPRKNIFIFV